MFGLNCNVLVLSPHTDDETLGCGGTIARLTALGATVNIALFSHGGAGIKWKGPDGYQVYSNEVRLTEFYSAISELGLSQHHVSLFSDGTVDKIHHKMDTVPTGEFVSFIEKLMTFVNPTVLLIPYAGYDQDHIAINHAAKVVMRPHFYAGSVLEYSVGSESDFIPNTFVKLTEEGVKAKSRAFACYATQKVVDHHLLSEHQMRTLSSRWGALVSAPYAEGFRTVRGVSSI
jgi:LmbE family N-acetylglucosaminyl deacetylase